MTAKVILAAIALCLAVVGIIMSIVFHKRNLADIKERQNHLDKASANLDNMQRNVDKLREIEIKLNELGEIQRLLFEAQTDEEIHEVAIRAEKLKESLVNREVESNSGDNNSYKSKESASNRNSK